MAANGNISLYSETKFLWLNRAENISSPPHPLPPHHLSETRDSSDCRKQLFPAANGPKKPSTSPVLSRSRCASNAVIYSKLRLQTDLLLTNLWSWESCGGRASPAAGRGPCQRPVPAGCGAAPGGHRQGAAGCPPMCSLQNGGICFFCQHLAPVPLQLQEGSRGDGILSVLWLPVQNGAGFWFFFGGVSACAKVGGCRRRRRRKGWWLAGSCLGRVIRELVQGKAGQGDPTSRPWAFGQCFAGWGRLGNMSLPQPRPRNPQPQHQRCPRRAEITGTCRRRAWSCPSRPGVVVQDTRLQQPPRALCPPQLEPRGLCPQEMSPRRGSRQEAGEERLDVASPGTRAASGSAREIGFSLPIRPIRALSASLLSSPRDQQLFRALTASPTGNET